MLKRTSVCCLLFLALLGYAFLLCAEQNPAQIRAVRIAGVINPVVADFIDSELEAANKGTYRAFLIELDTPGGLDSSMREIIQKILGSELPVIVYISPSGARAASAGALITLAADFAAMAPGTNIGAAHPVAIGTGGGGDAGQNKTMMEKVVNDAVAYARSIAEQRGRNRDWAEDIVRKSISTAALEAVKLEVIDLVADNQGDLLKQLDGETYLRHGQQKTLQVSGATIEYSQMSWRQEILNTISNPNVAYLLLMLGILGIFFEISQPGVILPGAIGALAILLAFLGLQMLPVNYVGVLLILLAIILFMLEIKVTSYGMLSVGGLIALTFGSLILVDSPLPYLQVSRAVIAATVATSAGFILLVLYFVVRVQKTGYVSGLEGMIGERGKAVTQLKLNGRVYLHGEYWDARAEEEIAAGAEVEVIRSEPNLKLLVRSVEPARKAADKETDNDSD